MEGEYENNAKIGLMETNKKALEELSTIQQRGMDPFCRALDVFQLVQSASEKMLAFCSNILQKLDYGLVHCQVLFLASTCERAHQIEQVMREQNGCLGVKIHSCVDGNSIEEDKQILSAGVHLVVGTPWRVSDLLCTQNQSLHPDHIRMVVLDEADEMLSSGFDHQIHNILSLLPAKVEVVALYATMPEDPLEIMRKLKNKPESMNLWQSIVFFELNHECP